MKLSEANRPLRVFDKVMQGGLGAGNIGVLMARVGTGKIGVMTCIAIDHAINQRHVLHVSLGKSVEDVRVYHDEVLHEFMSQLDPGERPGLLTRVERHKQIYSYRDGSFSIERLRDTLKMLADHAEFKPELIDIQGWPDFTETNEDELRGLKEVAREFRAEIWVTAHTHREDAVKDDRGVPDYIQRFENMIDVLVALEPNQETVHIKFLKTHDQPPATGINLEFDPGTQLIRWR